MSSIIPVYVIEVELAGLGAGYTSLTADIVLPAGLRIQHGINGSGPADLMAGSGSANFSINNSDANSAGLLGYYSLYHANKRTGWALGIRCRIRIQDPDTSTYWTRFIGRIDAIDPAPGILRSRQVRVTVVDWLDDAAKWSLTPAIGEQLDKTGDQILANILAEMPVQPAATSFDAGTEAYPYALDTSANAAQPALAEFAKLAASEFGPIYLTAGGTLRYEGRHTRMLNTASVWTIPDTDLDSLALPSSRADILNTVRTTIHPKVVDTDPTTIVYDQANPIFVPASTTKFLLGSFRHPVSGDPIGATDVQALVASTDYLANTLETGAGTDITSDFVVVVTIGAAGAQMSITNNNAAGGWLTRLQLRGRGVYDHGSAQKEARDATSVTAYGENVVHLDMPYQVNDDVGQGAADYVLLKYKDPLAQVRSIAVVGKTSALLTQILTRDISDRVTISETVTGANNAFFINGVLLETLSAGHLRATYTLAPAQDPFSGLYWILGTSVLGTNTTPAPF